MLYRRSFLFTYFTYSSVYMLIPYSKFISPHLFFEVNVQDGGIHSKLLCQTPSVLQDRSVKYEKLYYRSLPWWLSGKETTC